MEGNGILAFARYVLFPILAGEGKLVLLMNTITVPSWLSLFLYIRFRLCHRARGEIWRYGQVHYLPAAGRGVCQGRSVPFGFEARSRFSSQCGMFATSSGDLLERYSITLPFAANGIDTAEIRRFS